MTFVRTEEVPRKRCTKMTRVLYHCICDGCGNALILNPKFGKRLHHFCGRACYIQSQRRGGTLYDDIVKTNIERFGVKSYVESDAYKLSLQTKYGVDNVFQLSSTKEKIRKTNLEKYGVENIAQLHETQEKIRKTCKIKFGVDHLFKRLDVKTKAKINSHSKIAQEKKNKTCIERFGVENPFQSHEIKQRCIETLMNRHNVSHPMYSTTIKEKIKKTCIARYGVSHPQQNSEIHKKTSIACRKTQVLKHWKTGVDLCCTASYEVAFVNWCNANKIDFDWQIPHKMPNGRVYFIDAYIKDGNFADTWIEIKGWLTGRTKEKWDWFHSEHKMNSELWDRQRLQGLQII